MQSCLKYPGGKHYLAPWIVSLMPERRKLTHYVEPYFGSGAVLFTLNPIGLSETVNDVDSNLMNFWRVLRSADLSQDLIRRASVTPFAEPVFKESLLALNRQSFSTDQPDVDRAYHFFVACRQSMAGRSDSFAPLSRTRTRRGMNEQVSAWLSAVDHLPDVCDRLRRVVVLNHDALYVIREQDGPRTLFYLDPPYLHETRVTTHEYGDYEMTREQHEALLKVILKVKGFVMLSGYRNALYDRALKKWTRHEKSIANHASAKKAKQRMTECLWCNWR